MKTFAATILPLALILAACGGGTPEPVKTTQAAGKTVTLAAPGGKITDASTELTVRFTDASGQPAQEVQAESIRFFMPAMGSMAAMNSEVPLSPADKPGVFKGTVDLEMKGNWQTTVKFRDAQGPQRASFDILAR